MITTHDQPGAARMYQLFLARADGLTKAELAHELGWSMPTVTKYLKGLLAKGSVEPHELRASTGGRQARVFRARLDRRVGVGVLVEGQDMHCLAVNMAGRQVACARHRVRSAPQITALAHEFAAKVTRGTLAGVLFCLPDEFASAAQTPSDMRNARVTRAQAQLLAHTLTEPTLCPAVAISLDDTLTSAVALGPGLRDCLSAQIEHMRLADTTNVSESTPYAEHATNSNTITTCAACASPACLGVVCSLQTLAEEGESIPGFFSVLEQGELHHRARMQAWCARMATAVANLRAVLPAHVVLAGSYAQYLDEREIEQIRRSSALPQPEGTVTPQLRAATASRKELLCALATRALELESDDSFSTMVE